MSYDVETKETRALKLIERFVVVRESGNIPNDEWRGLWKDARALVEEIRKERATKGAAP